MLWKIVKRVVSPKNNQNGTWRLISDPLPPPLQMNTANGSGFPFQMLRQCICNNFILGNLSSQSLTTILNLKFFEFFGGHLTPNPYFSPPSTGISQTPQPVFFCRLASSGAGTTAAIVAAWNWNGAAGVILEISKSSPLGGLKKKSSFGELMFSKSHVVGPCGVVFVVAVFFFNLQQQQGFWIKENVGEDSAFWGSPLIQNRKMAEKSHCSWKPLDSVQVSRLAVTGCTPFLWLNSENFEGTKNHELIFCATLVI